MDLPLYIVIWAGGDDPPDYFFTTSLANAAVQAANWVREMEEWDTVDVIKVTEDPEMQEGLAYERLQPEDLDPGIEIDADGG